MIDNGVLLYITSERMTAKMRTLFEFGTDRNVNFTRTERNEHEPQREIRPNKSIFNLVVHENAFTQSSTTKPEAGETGENSPIAERSQVVPVSTDSNAHC